MNNTSILPIKNIIIKRVSEKKLRIKYDLPVYFHTDEKDTFLGYQKIGITLREVSNIEKPYVTYNNKLSNTNGIIYICSRPFLKFFAKIMSIYGLKFINNVHMPQTLYYDIFEEKYTHFIIPQIITLEGAGIKEIIRKWKIKNILKNNTDSEDIDL